MKIVSWNVNGLAACKRKGFLRFIADTKADVVCCQEIKTQCPLNIANNIHIIIESFIIRLYALLIPRKGEHIVIKAKQLSKEVILFFNRPPPSK